MSQPETIAIVTCNRQPSYIDELLSSMIRADGVRRVHLVVCGSSDAGYLERWRSHPEVRFDVHEADDQDRELSQGLDAVGRTILTTARALELADGTSPFVLFEDDALCGDGWLEKARAAAAKLDGMHPEGYLLALYATYRLPCDLTVVPYHPSNFYGNVALWFSPEVAVELGRRMRQDVSERRFVACDMITKRLLWDGTPAYAHSPSIVQHIGDVSTRGHTYVIRATSFQG